MFNFFFGNIPLQLVTVSNKFQISVSFKTINTLYKLLIFTKDKAKKLSRSDDYFMECESVLCFTLASREDKFHLALVNILH